MAEVRLAEVALPDFGTPTVEPRIPAATYHARVEDLRTRMRSRGIDALVVYADREHSANLCYLTGFDPRFEEALLILRADAKPTLLVGNECKGYAGISPLPLDVVLFQPFSLPGQSRDRSRPLTTILADAGIGNGARVGVVGWKPFTTGSAESASWIEAPSYLVDTLREQTGDPSRVTNAGDLLMDARDGLRTRNDVDQLAAFEYAACHTSTAVRNVLFGLRPGMSEYDAVTLMGVNGMPWSCHLMLSTGARAAMGLPSPSARIIARGDRFTTAYGVWGALNCRAGFVVGDADELPEAIRDYVERLVAPYFRAVVEWYETLELGVRGGALHDVVARHLGDPFFGIFLNPGHQIHLDEWVNSPIYEGSDIPLGSGTALQVDIIPATGTDYFTTNIEDGIALADAPLRAAFRATYPEAWRRIERRRRFVVEALGIRLRPEVLPFSNIPAYLPPFLLSPQRVMTAAPH